MPPEIYPQLPAYALALMGGIYLLLFLLWGYAARIYSSLPEVITIHFGIDLKPDGWRNKKWIFLLPFVYTFLVSVVLLFLNHPWTFHYPVAITPENYQAKYAEAIITLRTIFLGVGLLFLIILHFMIKASRRSAEISSL